MGLNSVSFSAEQNSSVRQNGSQTGSGTLRTNRVNMTPLDFALRKEKRKNGLIEKLYDKIKNLTGLGIGSKRTQENIIKAQKGEISGKEALKSIKDYGNSQETSAQLAGDVVSIAGSCLTFNFLNKYLRQGGAFVKLNPELEKAAIESIDALDTLGDEAAKNGKKSVKKWVEFSQKVSKGMIKHIKQNKSITIASAVAAALVGGNLKLSVMQLNRLGSKEFKADEAVYGKKSQRTPRQKQAAKKERNSLRKQKFAADARNFASGAINGLMSPLLALGAAAAVPAYLIGSSLNRYFIGCHNNKDKSFGGYAEHLKNDGITQAAAAAAAAIPMAKKAQWTKVYNGNIDKVVDKLSKAELKKPDFAGKTAREELPDILLNSPKIKEIILEAETGNIDGAIGRLTNENLFAVKFKQTSSDHSQLAKALHEMCPPTRTIERAQIIADKALGKGYKISKLLGVGTVAETYLAKDASGKEVCIKMLKDGISKEKILKDKQKFVEMIKSMPDKSSEGKEFLIRNIDDLAEGILKEVDLSNEMTAAEKLLKSTKAAKVVKPIKVRNNVYVMEKADGISLSSLMELAGLELAKKDAAGARLSKIEAEIKKIQARTPDYGDISLSEKDAGLLIDEYGKVLVEQFHKIDKNGKVIHADIHPGNIFIDVNALKARKGKIFTLIDTGNTIEQGAQESIHALNLTSYKKYANIPDLTEYVLEGAKLPQGMSKEEAVEKVSEEFRKIFFDDKTSTGLLTNKSILDLAEKIMQKYKIIPGGNQLNLNKAIQSAGESKGMLTEAIGRIYLNKIADKAKSGIGAAAGEFASIAAKEGMADQMYRSMIKRQEKLNLKQMTKEQRLKQKHNPNNKPDNSEDYLTATLKQFIVD